MGDPMPLWLTNDGSLVAYNARDPEHQTNLWLGNLADGSVEVAYVATEKPGHKVDIWWPQLAGGQLLWIEYVHQGANVQTPVTDWSVKRMDVSTRQVTLIAAGRMPDLGGKKYPERIRWDGRTVAVMEGLAKDKWQIELWNEAGKVQQAIPVTGVAYDVALVDGGVIFTAGTLHPEADTVGQMRLYRWTADGGTKQIGVDVYDVTGCSDLAAWIADPVASQHNTGFPVSQRTYAAWAPFEAPIALSPAPSEQTGIPGVDIVSCDSGTVAWLEAEGSERSLGIDILTIWRSEWPGPIQVETSGEPGDLSVKGGWIVWFEYNLDFTYGRLRGFPISALA
jgi:hypothetical protein